MFRITITSVFRPRKEGRYKFHDLQREPLERLADRWLVPPRTEAP